MRVMPTRMRLIVRQQINQILDDAELALVAPVIQHQPSDDDETTG